MARITLITGGSRSGKSTYAEKLCIDSTKVSNKELLYIATCPKVDDEMDDRIERHKNQRANHNWQTIEEELDLEKIISENSNCCILVECLTLWISNLIWQAEKADEKLTEALIYDRVNKLIKICEEQEIEITFVTNETGMGIMPINDMARLFSDLSGRANQTLAQAANDVYFMVSSLPMKVK